ncbi:ATP-dependent zinc protease [Halomonas elongata]|uniref:ATP-dependent zinc protease n=1 Tax=Halomonas elongata (strain ATCC 33173 / DSM 2581 / NBRC 15536 / NCIMB 2198 / 1H9) TaxID=768066 RepID=E1V710_HALED|nr:ATP-dependent zinc protease [Halomonas elongata]WBF17137.1 ATP-dependent zinc protease [Halomonas elongata]WPU45971.1 ATP-dependent zinc protease [Halomonas elongata DSM 2581]CBV43389.1 peptidase domain protein [Halomonas elongata DSM 2581]
MHAILRPLLLTLVLLPSWALAADEADADRALGWVEKVTLEPWDVEIKAKLDSGALTSSMDARDIEVFEKDGEEWVRFRLDLEDEANGESFSKTLERPLYRDLAVRGAGGRDERPVVVLEVCVGDTRYEEQFSLRDRGEMNYPMLLGRRSIGHLGVLDVRETFTTKPDCDADSPLKSFDAEG